MKCPRCDGEAAKVGAFWVCPVHGQLPEPQAFAPMRIFLSYGHDSNEELVRRLKEDLEKRGHDVWFDKSEIKFGDNWRHSITDGILKSNRVLSFLSKYSTRDPGVCRDEIAIAIGVKGGNIQTILVESEQEVQPPVNIGHIQWLDMHEWKERYVMGEAAWEPWYQAKLSEIIRVVESEESRRFAGEIETLNGHLRPIKSEARICQLLSKGFYGRQWLFEAVEEWRNPSEDDLSHTKGPSGTDSRLFWIIGAPGVGKSAFAAQLTHTRGDTVVAAQFCEWDKPDHRDARRVVRSLAFQLATRLPDYRKFLLTLPEIAELDRKDAAELFDYLLANPLRSVIHGGRDRYLIVIDALDEAGEAGRNPLVEMLACNAQRLPDWLGLVVTSRPEFDVKTPLQALNPFPLDTRSESNRADIRDYLRRELATPLQNRPDADRLVEQILEKSEGVFLYVERFCDDVQHGHLSLDRPEQFPQGLGGIFCQWFQRQFPDLEKFRKDVRPAFRAILAAREPLPVEILQRLFHWQDEELRDFTRTLGSLFPVTKEVNGEVIKPYHKSLVDWLADEAKAGAHFVSVNEGHRMLANLGWGQCQNDVAGISPYCLKHLPHHLVSAARIPDLASLLQIIGYVSRVRNEADIVDLLRLAYGLLAEKSAAGLLEKKAIRCWIEACPEEVLGQLLQTRYAQEGSSSLPLNLQPWHGLLFTYRRAVIGQVQAALQILENVGFCIHKLDSSKDEPITTFDEAMLTFLAKEAHERWCQERLADGWIYGPERDDASKTHNCIVPWSEFPEKYREFDRQTCRHWLVSFRALGYGVFRKYKTRHAAQENTEDGTERGNVVSPHGEFVETCARQWHQDYVNGVVSRTAQNTPESVTASFTAWHELPLRWRERWWRQVTEIIRILKKCSFTIVLV